MRKYHVVLAFILFVVCVTAIAMCGCSGNKKIDSGVVLKTTKDVFITTSRTAKRLCEQGTLSDADCAAVEDAYNNGRELLIQAHSIWGSSIELSRYDEAKYRNILNSVSNMTATIETIIREYD